MYAQHENIGQIRLDVMVQTLPSSGKYCGAFNDGFSKGQASGISQRLVLSNR